MKITFKHAKEIHIMHSFFQDQSFSLSLHLFLSSPIFQFYSFLVPSGAYTFCMLSYHFQQIRFRAFEICARLFEFLKILSSIFILLIILIDLFSLPIFSFSFFVTIFLFENRMHSFVFFFSLPDAPNKHKLFHSEARKKRNWNYIRRI